MAPCPQMRQWLKDIFDSSYCTFLLSLFATILSFADPVTDILTLVGFYRDHHKTRFGVGLFFVVLPCLAFIFLYFLAYNNDESRISQTEACLCGFHPFSSAWIRLKICWKNFKKCCGDNNPENKADCNLDIHSDVARFLEAVLESAPQFILQLYAMSVQQEPVKIIQIISLCVSLLSLVWAFTAADEYIHLNWLKTFTSDDLNVTHKVFLLVTHLFLLSSRLFATGFFTVTYKWWIISVMMIHSLSILTVDACWVHRKTGGFSGWSGKGIINSSLKFSLHWLRDDMTPTIKLPNYSVFRQDRNSQLKRMLLFSNILSVIENSAMIVFFYLGPFSNTWYSLPVTVCVCSFSVIGATARVTHFRFLTKETNNGVNSPTQQNDNNNEPRL